MSYTIFQIFLGLSRVQFAVEFDGQFYVGTINKKVFCKSTDYSLIRDTVTKDMEFVTNHESMN